MPNKEVHIGDDWYLGENNDGNLIVVNSNTGKVVKAIDKETGAEKRIIVSSPLVALGDTESLTLWRGTAPSDLILSIKSGSLTDNSGGLPSGCEIRLNNITNGVQTTLITSTYTEKPDNDDIGVGGDDIAIEVYNGSGATQNLTGNLKARLG